MAKDERKKCPIIPLGIFLYYYCINKVYISENVLSLQNGHFGEMKHFQSLKNQKPSSTSGKIREIVWQKSRNSNLWQKKKKKKNAVYKLFFSFDCRLNLVA